MASIEQLAVQQFANQTIPFGTEQLFNPLIEAIKPIMGTVSALVGGLFGLYLIFIVARLYYERKKVNLLKDIKYDLEYLNQHFKLPYSQQKKFRKKIIPLSEFKNKEKEQKNKNKEGKLNFFKKR